MKVLLLGLGCLVMCGCASLRPNAYSPKDLAGKWRLTLPAGATMDTNIVLRHDGNIGLRRAGNLSGIYELHNRHLIVVKPAIERLTEYVWQVKSPDLLVLVTAPPVSKIGSDYSGATLTRLP